jgi:hypothetical protein
LKAGLSQRSLRFGHDCAKSVRFVYGQISQNFAIHFDTCQGQTVDETAVRQSLIMAPACCIDTLDPQATEITLAGLPVARGVLVGLIDGLGRCFEQILPAARIAFGSFNDFLVTGVGYCPTFNT